VGLQYEPGEGYNTPVGNSVTARYTLTVSGLVPGANYTTYRYPGRLPPRRLLCLSVLTRGDGRRGQIAERACWQCCSTVPPLAWAYVCLLASRKLFPAFGPPSEMCPLRACVSQSICVCCCPCSQPQLICKQAVHSCQPCGPPQHTSTAQVGLHCQKWLHVHSLHGACGWTGHHHRSDTRGVCGQQVRRRLSQAQLRLLPVDCIAAPVMSPFRPFNNLASSVGGSPCGCTAQSLNTC
jgi:hypothetical protein